MKRRIMTRVILASAWVASACTHAVDRVKTTIKAADDSDVPVEVAVPSGKDPFPPVPLIHTSAATKAEKIAVPVKPSG